MRQQLLEPITDLANYPLLGLKEAATKKGHLILTRDELAVIILYTMQTRFYGDMNRVLRTSGERAFKLEKFMAVLKLFFNARAKLSTRFQGALYRGIKVAKSGYTYAESKAFYEDCLANKRPISWWGFSSCAKRAEPLAQPELMGPDGDRIMFVLDVKNGLDIEQFSAVEEEKEVLLYPGSTFKVTRVFEVPCTTLLMVHLEEDPIGADLFQ